MEDGRKSQDPDHQKMNGTNPSGNHDMQSSPHENTDHIDCTSMVSLFDGLQPFLHPRGISGPQFPRPWAHDEWWGSPGCFTTIRNSFPPAKVVTIGGRQERPV